MDTFLVFNLLVFTTITTGSASPVISKRDNKVNHNDRSAGPPNSLAEFLQQVYNSPGKI